VSKKRVFKLSDFDSKSCEIVLPQDDGGELTLLSENSLCLIESGQRREWGTISDWEKTLFPQSDDYKESEWLTAVMKTTHHLLEPEVKARFESWESLAEKMGFSIEIILELQKGLLYVLRGSELLIDKFEEEVKKKPREPESTSQTKEKESEQEDWAKVAHLFFEHYHWSKEQFLSLTLREVVAFVNEIQASKVEHYKFLASLEGHKLETNFEEENSTSLSVEQEEKIKRHLEKLNEKIRSQRGQK
jgi:hypothetical protein